MRILFVAYRRLGRWAFTLLLYPVIGYFLLTAGHARRASREYLAKVRIRQRLLGGPEHSRLNTFAHILQFGHAILDKGAMWAGVFPPNSVEFDNPRMLEEFRKLNQGSLFIGSHLGNLEVLRAFAGTIQGFAVNALVSTRNSPKLNELLSIVSPRALEGMIEIDSLGPDAVIKLQDKIRAGEHIAIAGDRVSVRHEERSVFVPFLGAPAPFPEGPFILASLLGCPVYLLFCVKIGKKYRIFLERFADPLELPRATRRVELERVIARYAQRLEVYCLMAPTQWFNFFDFWSQAGSKRPH